VPGDAAQHHREAHQPEAEQHPGRCRGEHRLADPLDADPDSGDPADGTPISTREDLAELLKAADAALFVARRGVRLPAIAADLPHHEPGIGLPDADLPTLADS